MTLPAMPIAADFPTLGGYVRAWYHARAIRRDHRMNPHEQRASFAATTARLEQIERAEGHDPQTLEAMRRALEDPDASAPLPPRRDPYGMAQLRRRGLIDDQLERGAP